MNHSEKKKTYFSRVICHMLYSFIFSCYVLVGVIDAADPEKLIFQKVLLLALDQKTMLLLE